MSCKECVHKELCDTYARFGVTDVPLGTDMPCELFMDKSALEKQMPKKPIKDEYGFLHCPYCDYDDYSLMHDSNFSDRYNYCCHCGQAISWEGDSE